MKKIKIYLPLFVVVMITATISLTYDVMISNVYAIDNYNEQVSSQKDKLWSLGKNLSVDDSYTYKICDPNTIQTSAANYHYFTQGNNNHNSSVCYLVKLDFVDLLNSDENEISNDIWVVQAAITDYHSSQKIRYSVFHIDTQTFEVNSADTIHPETIKYTDSLQNTLFSLHKYTTSEPQLLQTGSDWGEVTEALQEKGENPRLAVLDNNQEYTVTQNYINPLTGINNPIVREIQDAFQVGYEMDVIDSAPTTEEDDNNNVVTSFLISSGLPFPLSAASYSPVHVTQPQKQFEFELVSFMTNNNKDIVFRTEEQVVEEEVIVVEETIVESIREEEKIIVVEENVEEIEETTVIIIEDELTKEETVIEETITDEILIEEIKEDSSTISLDTDDNQLTEFTVLAVFLILILSFFVYFKKIRKSKGIISKKQNTIQKTIVYDDNVTINITQKDDS